MNRKQTTAASSSLPNASQVKMETTDRKEIWVPLHAFLTAQSLWDLCRGKDFEKEVRSAFLSFMRGTMRGKDPL